MYRETLVFDLIIMVYMLEIKRDIGIYAENDAEVS